MKYLFCAVLLTMACATVSDNPYAYNEMDSCPSRMSDEQQYSGVVRCRAMCSSYGRDFAEYDAQCRCWCMPGMGKAGGGYRVAPKPPRHAPDRQTQWSPPRSAAPL